MTDKNKLPLLSRHQVEAMDETAGYVGATVTIPAEHGGDMRALAILRAPVVDGLNNGTQSLNIEGWDD